MSHSKKKPYTKFNKPEPVRELPETGKLQPQCVDIEEAIIGAILLESACFAKVIDILKPEAFYKEEHQIIYRAAKHLHEKALPIDMLTVVYHLKEIGELDKVGGPYAISKLTNKVASSAHIEYHARLVLQEYIRRELIISSTINIKDAYEPGTDVFDILEKSQTGLSKLSSGIVASTAKGSAKLFGDFMRNLENVSDNDNAITGVCTSLRSLDVITRGFQKSDVIVIAGRPGAGKSSALKPIIRGAISQQRPILLYSLEMSAGQQIARLLSEDAQIPSQAFNSKEFLYKTNFNELNSIIPRYFDKDQKDLLIIDDSASLTIQEIKSRSKKIASEHNICCILIDYIGMIKAEAESKVYELEEIMAGIKQLAKELSLPIVVLSQLNRDVEKDKPPRPKLSHLRSSGALEQFSDLVITIYRPEYYGIMELEDGSPSHQVAYFDILKNRNGRLDSIKLRFNSELTKFSDWNDPIPIQNAPPPYDSNKRITPNTDFLKGKKDDKPDPF